MRKTGDELLLTSLDDVETETPYNVTFYRAVVKMGKTFEFGAQDYNSAQKKCAEIMVKDGFNYPRDLASLEEIKEPVEKEDYVEEGKGYAEE